jgi:hypothetical protein
MTGFRIVLLGAGLFGLAQLLGCNSGTEAKDSLAAYRGHVESAQMDLDAENPGESADYLARMHRMMEGHLDEMASIRGRMSNACTDLADCEDGGGATGNVDHGCMHGGHMLSRGDMDLLHHGEESILGAMHQFSDQCAADPSQCDDAHVDEHRGQIENLLTDMLDICDEMMSTDVDMGDDGHVGMCGMH